MTATNSERLLTRKGEQRGALPDAPLAPLESRLIGHLLGRREDAASIAEALGLAPAEVDRLCGRLLDLGVLKVLESHGRQLYCLH